MLVRQREYRHKRRRSHSVLSRRRIMWGRWADACWVMRATGMLRVACGMLRLQCGMFPRPRTLRDWARQYFTCWLRREAEGLRESEPGGHNTSEPEEMESGCDDPESALRNQKLRGRWTAESLYRFFEYKDMNGGNQGNHCLSMNLTGTSMLNLCFQRRQARDASYLGVTASS